MIDVALCVVYSDFHFFEETLESVKDFVKEIVFLVPSQTWSGHVDKENNTKVISIINDYLKEQNGKLIRVDTTNQADTLNFGLDFINDKNKDVLILDSDEIWDEKSKVNFLKYYENHRQYDIFLVHFHTYFKSIKWRIDPPQDLKACVLIKSFVRFLNARRTNSHNYKIVPKELVCLHHPSHVRDDYFMKIKVENCHERDRIINWYNDVWKNWAPDIVDFHPIIPEAFHSVVKVNKEDLPKILHKYLTE